MQPPAPTITLRFVVTHVLTDEIRRLNTPWAYDVNIEGDFALVIDGRTIYEEALFPLVELAAQLTHWLQGPAARGEDFHYVSVESDQPWLIRFTPAPGGWRVAAQPQASPAPEVLPLPVITAAIHSYTRRLSEELLQQFGLDIAARLAAR